MAQDFLSEMESKLLAMRAELLEKLSSDDDDFRGMMNAVGIKDSVDVAADDIAFKKMEAINQHDANRLKAVESALARLKTGRYGICLRCGKKIPDERLSAIPYAVLCVECKNGEEGPCRRNVG